MACKKLWLHHILVILYWLYFSYANCQQTTPESNLYYEREIEKIKNGWPIQDYNDAINTIKSQFYYLNHDPNAIVVSKFTNDLLNQIKNKSDTFKLSFKIWLYYEGEETPLVRIPRNIDDLYRNYNYFGDWMPLELFFQYQDLETFNLRSSVVHENNLVAYKDIKFEYETIKPTQTTSRNIDINDTITGWKKYINPQADPSSNTPYEFVYFSNDCNSGCEITLTNLKYVNEPNESITKYELLFKYYIKVKNDQNQDNISKIVVTGNELKSANQPDVRDGWHPIEYSTESKSLTNVKISITTQPDKKFTDISFIAIKDLTVKLTISKDNNTSPKLLQCTQQNCFNGNENLSWFQSENKLDNEVHYYPINNENSITIVNELADISKDDFEYVLEYKDSYGSIISVNHTTVNDPESNAILNFKSKKTGISANTYEKLSFKLNELIAINSKKSYVTISVKPNQIVGLNSFALKISKTEAPTVFKNDYSQNFLLQWDHKNVNPPERNISWKHEWPKQIPDSNLFDLNLSDDEVDFNAHTETQTPASAQLMSKWIKYHNNFHFTNITSKYSITVNNKSMFTAFTIRPKICDSLMHCEDVIILNETITNNDKNREYKFKFSELNTYYFRLVFYVEYYLPPNSGSTSYDVKFKLKLLHFGDGCDESAIKCLNGGECVTDPRTSLPNVYYCDCDSYYKGDLCTEIDFCHYFDETITAPYVGHNKCAGLNPTTACHSLTNAYRCQCLGENAVNSRLIYKQNIGEQPCKNVDDPPTNSKTNWKRVENQNKYYPNGTNNKLELLFEGISSENVDVCVKLEYSNHEENKNLTVYYSKTGTDELVTLFEIAITASESTTYSTDFCVRDFLYKYAENFSLIIQVKLQQGNWTSDNFTLTYSVNAGNYTKDPILFGHNWKFAKINDPTNEWNRQIPNNAFNTNGLFTKTADNMTVKFITTNVNTGKATALFMSEWIKGNTEFSKAVNSFSIRYKLIGNNEYSDKYITTRVKLYNFDNDKLTITNLSPTYSNSRTDGGYKVFENIRIYLPSSISNSSVFKIAFEYSYQIPKTENSSVEVEIYDVSIGDSCYIDNQEVCKIEKSTGKCTNKGPNDFHCECKDAPKAIGPKCDQIDVCEQNYTNDVKTNRKHCEELASVLHPLNPYDKCHTQSSTFQCVCPNGYKWDQNNNRCLRTGYDKVIYSCDGKSCDIFDTIKTAFNLSNKNLPDIKKEDQNIILPFYYLRPGKELTINISKLTNSQTDACFEFNYYTTSGSQIDIDFNGLNVLTIGSSKQRISNKDVANWEPLLSKSPEKICAKSFLYEPFASFNVSFQSLYLNTDNDSVAIKLKEYPGNKFVSFIENDQYPLSLPFITHISHSINKSLNSLINQWPIRFPSQLWTTFTDPSNVSKIELNNNTYDVSTYRDYLTFEDDLTKAPKTAYLISKWIKKYNEGSTLSFNLTDVVNAESFTLTAIIVDKDYKEHQYNRILNNATNRRFNIPIRKIETEFRLKLQIDYHLNSSVKYDVSYIRFSLMNIALGDPCVISDSTEFNICTGNGYCDRTEDNKNFKCVCLERTDNSKNPSIKLNWEGEYCQQLDYCNMDIPSANTFKGTVITGISNGTAYCKANGFGTCHNLPEMRDDIQFECTCINDTYWDRIDKICTPTPKCLSHTCPDPISQECHEADAKANETTRCKCKKVGFVTISDVGNDNSLSCQRYNPCNALHRNISDNGVAPCGSIANCVPIEKFPFNPNNVRDYYCVCPSNFNTKYEKIQTECESLYCEVTINKCKQKCDNNIKQEPYYNCSCYDKYYDYIKDTNDCKPKENSTCKCKEPSFCANGDNDCQCKNGYKYDNANEQCVLDGTTCKNGHINVTNGVPVCICNDGFEISKNNTCEYVSPCAQNPCDKTAVCIINPHDIFKHQCQCPEGTMFDNGEQVKETNQTCVPACQAQSRNEKCKSDNAICSPAKVLLTNETRRDATNRTQYCECRSGYVPANLIFTGNNLLDCSVAKYSTELTLEIKNTFNNSVNKVIQPQSRFFTTKRFKREATNSGDYRPNELPTISIFIKEQEDILNKTNAEHREALDQQKFIDELKNKLSRVLKEVKYNVKSITVDQCTPTQDNNYINCTFVIVTDEPSRKKNLSNLLQNECRRVDGTNCFFDSNGNNDERLTIFTASVVQDVSKLYEPCSDQRKRTSCPEYTTCIPSHDNDSYFSCTCDIEYFNASSSERLKTEDPTLNYRIERCIVNHNQCQKNCNSRYREDNPHGKCVQEAPIFNTSTKSWTSQVKFCGCEKEYWKESDSSDKCQESCPIDCNGNGNCVKTESVGYCSCNDGWSGDKCSVQYKASVGGWIAGIVVLAVLVVIVAIVALIFARRSRGASGEAGHPMDEYSHTSYRVGQQSSATARSQPSAPIVHASSGGRDNKGFSRD